MLVITLLVLAVCIDSFATSITYGIGKIKIPFHCTLLINIIGAAMNVLVRFFCAAKLENNCRPSLILLMK